MPQDKKVVALSGGIGGAKLALGLYRVLEPDRLTVVTNTGDDFEHLGLHVSPDTDTVMYTLAGVASRELGWGREDETWHFMEALAELGGETWFRLGDRDLATSVLRTSALTNGRKTLGEVTRELSARLGIRACIVPMSDDPVRTVVHSDAGPLPFQHYFVRDGCRPIVTGFSFQGARTARPAAGALAALADPKLAAIVVCPSNPYLSIDPILSVPGYRHALTDSAAPVIAVSPIVGGNAVKGPTAKMMRELGVAVSSASIAEHYAGLLDGLIVDAGDDNAANGSGIPVRRTRTLMRTRHDKEALAMETLAFAADIAGL